METNLAADVAYAVEILRPTRRILVFTGAGISTESGIPDFRGPEGLWTKVDPEDFHIDRYRANPDLRKRGWRMHLDGELWGARSTVRPNIGHEAIKRLADNGRLSGVVTQNVDGLHHQSGLDDELVAELHGNVRQSHCVDCDRTWATDEVLAWVEAGDLDPSCPECGGIVKTGTVMFGELLPEHEMQKAMLFLAAADAIIVVGSTVAVWPASDVVMRGAFRSLPIVIINQGATEADHLAAVKLDAGIGTVLPEIVDGLLGHR
ncbi:MAG TPA: Sir2 family NAD-dependent protein deacetylase [Acidimicrobiia bacterium]|nr:Sir2 family NAD-dependent protein deacetylase [Acidimicrobiia bacterium]